MKKRNVDITEYMLDIEKVHLALRALYKTIDVFNAKYDSPEISAPKRIEVTFKERDLFFHYMTPEELAEFDW